MATYPGQKTDVYFGDGNDKGLGLAFEFVVNARAAFGQSGSVPVKMAFTSVIVGREIEPVLSESYRTILPLRND